MFRRMYRWVEVVAFWTMLACLMGLAFLYWGSAAPDPIYFQQSAESRITLGVRIQGTMCAQMNVLPMLVLCWNPNVGRFVETAVNQPAPRAAAPQEPAPEPDE